eukprot:scaffold46121_cov20-Prasinocladus_malaysianus.AAC.1
MAIYFQHRHNKLPLWCLPKHNVSVEGQLTACIISRYPSWALLESNIWIPHLIGTAAGGPPPRMPSYTQSQANSLNTLPHPPMIDTLLASKHKMRSVITIERIY